MAVLLVGSVAANLWLAGAVVDEAHADTDRASHEAALTAERDALRRLALEVAANGSTRAGFAKAAMEAGTETFEKDGWVVAGPLMARFEGERLAAVCGSVHLLPDPCTGNGMEQNS